MQGTGRRARPLPEEATGSGHTAPRRWVRAAGWSVVAVTGALAATVALVPVPPGVPSAPPSRVYGAGGTLVGTLSGAARSAHVPLDAIPTALQAATIATEDASFYRNFGIDPLAIARAAWVDLRAGHIVEGGSTITQQLAKNLYLSNRRTLGRKLLEVLYTLRLDATHTKPQILDLYLNRVYYGEGAWGVGAAAQTYFAENVSHLDLAQSALLAGLPAAPALYDPYQHPRAARQRQAWVLHRMVATGAISEAQARAALAEPLRFRRGKAGSPAAPSYFVQYMLAAIGRHSPELEARVRAGGYQVYTTLNPRVQAAADQTFAKYMPAGSPAASGTVEPQGALVAINPSDGAVEALIGGRSARLDPFNRALYARRQPGSTFKPFLYATVLAQGYPPTATQLDDAVTYRGRDGLPYTVHDEGPYSNRPLTLREALAVSSNVVAVKWARVVGVARVIATARRMGITSPLQPTLPLVLGADAVTPLELADAYVPLANLGTAYAPWCIERVVGPGDHVAWAPRPPAGRRALDPGVAYLTTNLLESVMRNGSGRALAPIVGRPSAGKTGTSSGNRDAWFVGYTPDLVAAVWVGDDIPRALAGGGARLAGPVWAHFMARALGASPAATWVQPADVIRVRVSAIDGLLPNATSPTVPELFLRGHAPTRVSPMWGAAQVSEGLIGIPGAPVLPPLVPSDFNLFGVGVWPAVP